MGSEEEALPLNAMEEQENDNRDEVEEEKEKGGRKETDLAKPKKKRQCCGFPIAIFFILGNEFCERFSFYGMRTVLIPYFKNVVGFNDDDSTALTHCFNMLCYLSPVAGAVIADAYWGKYKTILIISLIHAFGNLLMALTTIPELGAGPGSWYGPIIGLIIVGVGTGGIKPCVAAFGGDQFDQAEEKQSARFFSLFYASINAGSLISTFLTPILKGNVACFDQDTCYPLAFGVPAILMLFSVVFFVIGGVTIGYVKFPPEGSIHKDFVRVVNKAISERCRNRGSGIKRAHWLDWAEGFYSDQLIADVKAIFELVLIFAPLPFFWSLYDQQGTMLVIQSYQMDSRVGNMFFQPEMMQVVNPILIILFIPIFDYIIYPLVDKSGIRTWPLRRIGGGLFLAAIAFIIAGGLELVLETQYLKPPKPNHGYITVINNNNKDLSLNFGKENIFVEKNQLIKGKRRTFKPRPFGKTLDIAWGLEAEFPLQRKAINIKDFDWQKELLVVVFFPNNIVIHYNEEIQQPKRLNRARISIISPSLSIRKNTKILDLDVIGAQPLDIDNKKQRNVFKTQPNHYKLTTSTIEKYFSLINGGVYSLSIFKDEHGVEKENLIETADSFYINIFWQVPQIITFTAGEVLLSITGLAFAYTQASLSMKSIAQSMWLLTIFFGNLVDAIIYASNAFTSLWVEFFFFSGLVFLVFIIFVFLARRYEYVEGTGSKVNRTPVPLPPAPLSGADEKDK